MPIDDIEQLFASLDNELVETNSSELELLKILMKTTLSFRDKLKESGVILTVDDTQLALNALNTHINNQKFPDGLSDIQKQLSKLLIDNFILFKYS